jgi:hypothetical protein
MNNGMNQKGVKRCVVTMVCLTSLDSAHLSSGEGFHFWGADTANPEHRMMMKMMAGRGDVLLNVDSEPWGGLELHPKTYTPLRGERTGMPAEKSTGSEWSQS